MGGARTTLELDTLREQILELQMEKIRQTLAAKV